MSVILQGMEMPKSCSECPIIKPCINTPFKAKEAFKAELFLKRPEFCQLSELPENHGRLIDADAFVEYLENEFKRGYENDQKSDADMKMLMAKMHELIITEIQKRPTVLENEG